VAFLVGPWLCPNVEITMKLSEQGNLVKSVSLALLAGIAGSLLTLFFTGNLISTSQGDNVPAALAESSAVDVASEDAEVSMDASADSLSAQLMAVDEQTELEQLREALTDASAQRSQFADIIAQLTRQIDTLESDIINIKSLNNLNAITEQPLQDSAEPGRADASGRRTGQATFENLVAAGISTDSAQALQNRQDQYQLARLELVDQAEREGWRDSDQFSQRLDELDSLQPDLRSELGDEAYDRYLFAAGRNNRVAIVSIIQGSEAELAGLEVGDVVYSYAGVRVFTTRELQNATRAGQRGEIITIQVQRQGQGIFISAARGPLGVTLDRTQQNPS